MAYVEAGLSYLILRGFAGDFVESLLLDFTSSAPLERNMKVGTSRVEIRSASFSVIEEM